MASIGIQNHNNKRLAKCIQAASKRLKLKNQLANPELSLEERLKISAKLRKNRNESFTRYRRRSSLDGRPRAVVLGDINRIEFREYANRGLLPGVSKASW